MILQLGNVENLVIIPFIAVFFICWFTFCALLIIKPQAWIEFQNRFTRQYGLEWRIIDEKRFKEVNKKSGIWLVVLGACTLLIILGFMTGFIPIFIR